MLVLEFNPVKAHKFVAEFNKENTHCPLFDAAAAPAPELIFTPVDKAVLLFEVSADLVAVPAYPLFSIPPEYPSWINRSEERR